MTWIVGIDEAGYGPNLGPLVMTSVACRVPEERVEADLWQLLRDAVRRHPEADDGRILIDDSKLVYSATRGLIDLESAVLTVASCRQRCFESIREYLDWVDLPLHHELWRESWFTGETRLPCQADRSGIAAAAARLEQAHRQAGLAWGRIRSVVVCPVRFNGLLDEWDSKGAVLAQGLTELIAANRAPAPDGEPLQFFVDKHGGRNRYAAMLQHALEDGLVLAREESLNRSVYRVEGLERPIRFTFQPRADAAHLCVALASMFSKYLRELLMEEFNRFWRMHVPDLEPTAGYPGDAARFLKAIRPAMQRLGIAEESLWRRK